ncbi:17110_t:CDS:2 [Cetraspora pellucida]|uniref:17110_t:CDS:1 n=1 Tax=Cetraspora pellucida TaxID=1433469 RepID=A0A9N9P7W4_9GLOM|nr:17110_t:CDS:2 [Cetraspora pellucida]
MVYLFDIPAYFIILRETLEVTIILAVLLGFIDNLLPDDKDIALRKQFKKQLWIGSLLGLIVSLLLGGIFIAVFYTAARNLWNESEPAWGEFITNEGTFSLIATIVITIMSLSMLRVQQWKKKWENKLQGATELYLERHNKGNKWALILLPFTVICREALESIVFIAGVGYDKDASGLPIPIITGLITGFFIGWLIYKGSHTISLKIFFIATTTLLLFIAAGLFSRAVYEFHEISGAQKIVVWQLNCCDPEGENEYFWAIMGAIFGWRNVATVDSTVSYFVYWFVIIIASVIIIIRGKKADDDVIDTIEHNDSSEKDEKDAANNDIV